jgi:hypothetical protein
MQDLTFYQPLICELDFGIDRKSVFWHTTSLRLLKEQASADESIEL